MDDLGLVRFRNRTLLAQFFRGVDGAGHAYVIARSKDAIRSPFNVVF